MIVPIIEITTRCGEGPDVPREIDGLNKHAGAKGGSPWPGLCCRRDTLMLSVRRGSEHLTTEQIQRATAAATAEIIASGVPPIVARDAYSFWETLNWVDLSLAPALKPLVEAWIAAANAAEEILEEGLEDEMLVCGELTAITLTQTS